MLIVPKCAEDIRKEGETLHHCAATYIEKVAAGKTNILFIRKADKPDEPYYTMEFKNGRIVQCRGKRNCDMTVDVKKFTEHFLKELDKSKRRGNDRAGKKVV